MKDLNSINENTMDGALNASFLETYSRREDADLALFFLGQNYNVPVDAKKEAAMLARLNRGSGGRYILWTIIAGLLLIASTYYYVTKPAPQNLNSVPQQQFSANTGTETGEDASDTTEILTTTENAASVQNKTPVGIMPNTAVSEPGTPAYIPAAPVVAEPPVLKNDSAAGAGKEVPYFKKAGLEFFGKVKEQVLKKLQKIDDRLYGKTEPGVTFYKAREVTVPPFVMANFPVTNLEYKVFLADLAMQGRVDDMKKCLPKGEIWKQYGCISLAKDYFENEVYNDFPVVNVTKEATVMYCEWLEKETNAKFEEEAKNSKTKNPKKKQVIVRLPYDYEWIYSADAANALVPDCGGYNTIYDPSEGLVDKDFFKRTSQITKRDVKNETRMDKLSDVNRFGMTEAEIIAIYREAINFNSGKKVDASDPASYPNNVEACCLAGHVCELISTKDGGMTARGCCWKNKDEYLEMMDAFKKNGASPFIGFRVLILNVDKGTNRNPFWN